MRRGLIPRGFALIIIVVLLIAAATACSKGVRYGWQSTAVPPTPNIAPILNATPQPTSAATPTPGAQPSGTPGGGGGAAHGEQLYHQEGCSSCHSTDGSQGAGPTWKGLYGRTVTLSDGSTVTANDAYIEQSIVDPSAKIVKGFSDIMPKDFGQKLSKQDIQDIIDYIKTLK